MPATYPLGPPFEQKQLDGARLFAGRNNMILGLNELQGGKVIAEVGVAEGVFSEFLIKTLKPKQFVAFDLFDRHTFPQIYSKPAAEIYDNKTQLEFYRDRLASLNPSPTIEVGPSTERLAAYPDHYFDMIYIDAAHDYESVKADGELARQKTKPGGMLIFNDYTLYDHIARQPYGIVPVVNQMVVEHNYRVVGYALDNQMFCDIAVRLTPADGR